MVQELRLDLWFVKNKKSCKDELIILKIKWVTSISVSQGCVKYQFLKNLSIEILTDFAKIV